MTPSITFSNLFIPSVLILAFLLINNRGSQNVSCRVEETLKLGDTKFSLTAAVIAKTMHFIAVTKIRNRFYNWDNLETGEEKKGFLSFIEALINHETPNREELLLDNRTAESRRAGGVNYLVYVGEQKIVGDNFQQYQGIASSVNSLLGKSQEEGEIGVSDAVSMDTSELEPSASPVHARVKEHLLPHTSDKDPPTSFTPLEDKPHTAVLEGVEQVEQAKPRDSGFDDDEALTEKRTEDNNLDIDEFEDVVDECFDEDEDFIKRPLNDRGQLGENDEPGNIDLRLQTFQDMGRLMRLYPGAYFDFDKSGWLCRKCQAFAFLSSESNPWTSGGVDLGEHPKRKMVKHFQSNLHKKSIESEQLFNETSVYQLLCAQDLNSRRKEEEENRTTLKNMFTIALHMVKHCQPNDVFEDNVKLVSNAGSVEMKEYLSNCPKNATYLSHHSYRELLEVMNEYVEKPILEALRSEFFTIFIDETTAVGNKSVANVYVMFDDGNGVNEHYLGTVNMNAGLGLTAKHFYDAVVELCRKKGISLADSVFSEMDGCATNQGRSKGLKNYFTFHNPHHISESCGSHKLALLPQKLVVESDLNSLAEADKLAVGVSAFFKGSSLRTAIFEHTQTILRNKVLKLISPSPTRWLTHGQCFERLIELLQPALVALNSLYTDKEDFKALGFLLGMIQSNFLLSCLALHDIFKVLSLLTHWLQTSPADADITRVPVLVKNTVEKLL